MDLEPLFSTFFMGGFECSTHRRRDGIRLDLVASTRHDRFAEDDYRQLQRFGMRTARDGVRWHLIERSPGNYDWSSFLPMLHAARRNNVQIIWDLCHYGWPDDIDIWSEAFVERFRQFSAAVARVVKSETDEVPLYCPINEVSFWAWAGGDAARINPFANKRAGELKRQLALAWIAAAGAVREVEPKAQLICAEPAIHVLSHSPKRKDQAAAERYRLAQFEACDMICGRMQPELGGQSSYLDVVGLNFYPDNQWIYGGKTIPFGHHSYRPLHEILVEVYERYQKPILLSETGAEGSARASWLHYVGAEVRNAMAAQIPILGVCLYPVLDYQGWENDRPCAVGLLGSADANGTRPVYAPLAEELKRQQLMIEALKPSSGDALRVGSMHASMVDAND